MWEERTQDTTEQMRTGRSRNRERERPQGRAGRPGQSRARRSRGGGGAGGGAGGEEKRVMRRDLALESGGWFIKCSKVQVEKVRMDLTCLRRW